MSKISGYAALEVKGLLQPFSYESGDLGANDVEVMISHCGICYSDIYLIDNDWGRSKYPFVPGHEIYHQSRFRIADSELGISD